MEVGMDVEDGLFFADLNKQISLLIMDDDDPLVHTPSVSLQAFSRAIYPATQPPIFYHQTCTRGNKGTGVFIPQLSSQQRRRNRQAKYNSSSNSKYHRQLNENSRGIMINNSHGSNYYMNVPPRHSFETKKHVDYIYRS